MTETELTPEAREAAHRALDVWIEDCEREAAEAYDSGRGGYLGSLTLRAESDSDGALSLTVERTITCVLP
jgi:hypothetical protein